MKRLIQKTPKLLLLILGTIGFLLVSPFLLIYQIGKFLGEVFNDLFEDYRKPVTDENFTKRLTE